LINPTTAPAGEEVASRLGDPPGAWGLGVLRAYGRLLAAERQP
jgi:hypothetical protein